MRNEFVCLPYILATAVGLVLVAGAKSQTSSSETGIVVNDVTRLNPIHVEGVYSVQSVDDVRAVLEKARREHRKVSIAGKRHSQGGQTAYPQGMVLDMTHFNKILGLDQSTKVIAVQSGATWEQVQNYAN